MNRMRLTLGVLGVAAVALLPTSSPAARVTAELQPAEVSLGESAELTVTVTGTRADAPQVPAIDGLHHSHVGQSTQIQIINGTTSATASHTFLLTPQRAGTFSIPPIEVAGAKSQPVTLRVSKGSGAASAQTRSTLPPPNVSGAAPPAGARDGSLQLVLPKREFYSGEVAPVEVRAFLPQGARASITGLPTLSSEAFTLSPLSDKPTRSEQLVDGEPYTVLTWHSTVTAVKAGNFALSMQMPATVVVRDQPRRRSGRSIFDDFFDDPFFARGREKEVTFRSGEETLKVLPLPTEGKPASFTGAVGSFDLDVSAEPLKANAGDPMTLRLKVSGAGNFDRISAPMLDSAEGWKSYKPKSRFEPSDSAGFGGAKTFKQVIIPTDASTKAVPALTFSFFDPEAKRYVTRTTTPIPVDVQPAPAGTSPNPATASELIASDPARPGNTGELLPNKVRPGRFVSTLRPLFLQPWFIVAQAVPLLALGGGLIWMRHRDRLANDPQLAGRLAAERAIHAQLDAMDAAAGRADSLAFFPAARAALQQRLGALWNLRPEAITRADLDGRLGDSADDVLAIFEMADCASYSGAQLDAADLRAWKERVLVQLKQLKRE